MHTDNGIFYFLYGDDDLPATVEWKDAGEGKSEYTIKFWRGGEEVTGEMPVDLFYRRAEEITKEEYDEAVTEQKKQSQ